MMPPERQVFVTVGTTEFDALVEAADSDATHAALAALGYTRVLFQVGRGSARPRGPAGSRSSRLPTACFDFAPSLDEHVCASALVISHAGAGSIMDALGRRKPLVVVVNDGLMDNHQTELADVRGSERAPVPFAFFCFKLLFFVPQSGGKAHAVVGLIARLGELSALCVCAAVAVGWWLLWDAAFRRYAPL